MAPFCLLMAKIRLYEGHLYFKSEKSYRFKVSPLLCSLICIHRGFRHIKCCRTLRSIIKDIIPRFRNSNCLTLERRKGVAFNESITADAFHAARNSDGGVRLLSAGCLPRHYPLPGRRRGGDGEVRPLPQAGERVAVGEG